jgi:hypothetical protein
MLLRGSALTCRSQIPQSLPRGGLLPLGFRHANTIPDCRPISWTPLASWRTLRRVERRQVMTTRDAP